MEVKIKFISNKNKKIKEFALKEWKRFTKERGYLWKKKKYVIAAYKNNKIVGYAEFKINGGAGYLSQLLVKKERRREKIGERLISEFENFLKKKKSHVAYLETSESHKEALKFYKKQKYKIVAKLKNNKFHFTWYILEKRIK